MSKTPSAPCPNCRAHNFTYRRDCWKCGRTMPASFKSEGLGHARPAQAGKSLLHRSTTVPTAATRSYSESSTSDAESKSHSEFKDVIRGILEKCRIF